MTEPGRDVSTGSRVFFDDGIDVMVCNVPVEEEPAEHVRSRLHILPSKNINGELLRAIIVGLEANPKSLGQCDRREFAGPKPSAKAKDCGFLQILDCDPVSGKESSGSGFSQPSTNFQVPR